MTLSVWASDHRSFQAFAKKTRHHIPVDPIPAQK